VSGRDVLDDHFHTWANPCLYSNVGFDTRDDDGGTASDSVMVVATGVDSRQRGSGYWKNEYAARVGQSLAGTTLGCYLQIVSFMSAVFPEAHPLATAADAAAILQSNPPAEQDKLDKELLTTWLDFANGALPYASFVNQVTAAERVRLNPAATQADLRDQRQILQRLNND
jgi:hypothetical protein